MTWLIPEDWSQVFVPQYPLLEIFVRGTAVYLFLFFALRVVMKREAAGIGISDLLVVVLLADAAQNAMSGGYTSVPDGLLLVTVIIGWDWGLSYLAFRIPAIRWLIRPRPILLIKNGKVIDDAVRHELLTMDEIMGNLREQGIERIEDVKHAHMESDGVITAVPLRRAGAQKNSERRRRMMH